MYDNFWINLVKTLAILSNFLAKKASVYRIDIGVFHTRNVFWRLDYFKVLRVSYKWSSLPDKVRQYLFTKLTPGVDLMKLFWGKFTYPFCKLDLFRSLTKNLIEVKLSSLQKDWVNLHQKVFMRSAPGACTVKHSTDVISPYRNKLESLSLSIPSTLV